MSGDTFSGPTFAPVFGPAWAAMPEALHLHYANRPFSRDRVTVTGTLTIRMGAMMRLIAPVFGALGMLTPHEGEDIACTVHFLSEPHSNAFVFERWFTFPGRKPFRFRSKLVPIRGNEVIEYMACGIGWRCTYGYEDDKVMLRHLGYVWRLFGMDIPLPGTALLMGRGEAFEEATGPDGFRMRMGVSGSLWGNSMAYSYAGNFTVTEVALENTDAE